MTIKEMLKKTPIYPIWHKMRLAQVAYREKKKGWCYRKYGNQVLTEICAMAIEEGYPLYCTWGTLLGLVREGGLIPWDDDMDFSILPMDGFSWKKLENDMVKRGFTVYREVESDTGSRSVTFKKKGVVCDIGLNPNDGKPFFSGGYEIPGGTYINGEFALYEAWEYVFPIIPGIHEETINGLKVLLPDNTDDVIVAMYGENWRTPMPDYYAQKKELKPTRYKITYL